MVFEERCPGCFGLLLHPFLTPLHLSIASIVIICATSDKDSVERKTGCYAVKSYRCIHVSGLLGNLVRASLPRYRSFSGFRTPHCSSSFLQQQSAVYYNRPTWKTVACFHRASVACLLTLVCRLVITCISIASQLSHYVQL